MNLYKGYCTQIIRTCQVSEKKQINKDQIVQDYTRSLVEFYNKSKILPVQVIDNLFEQEHSNKIKNLILDYEKKIQLEWTLILKHGLVIMKHIY